MQGSTPKLRLRRARARRREPRGVQRRRWALFSGRHGRRVRGRSRSRCSRRDCGPASRSASPRTASRQPPSRRGRNSARPGTDRGRPHGRDCSAWPPSRECGRGPRRPGTGTRAPRRCPPPARLATVMKPPWASTILRVIGSPRPVPSPIFFVVQNGSNSRPRSACRDAGARVLDGDDDEAQAARRRQPRRHPQGPAGRHRVDRVRHQVVHRPAHVTGVDEHCLPGRQYRLDPDLALGAALPERLQRFPDDRHERLPAQVVASRA